MRIVIFSHSLVSDWNHGNAHFLRGVASELIERGHSVGILEPRDGWSRSNLLAEYGSDAIKGFEEAYPELRSSLYDAGSIDLDATLHGADLVIVHEWNPPELVAAIGRHRQAKGLYRLLFHDTHHRCVTAPESMSDYDLTHYDGVLAYGDAIRNVYREKCWARNVWTWHEAADTRMFYPRASKDFDGDLVWVGNWGDDERAEELHEFLIAPVTALHLKARIYGVRYPQHALDQLEAAGIEYCGWLPNYRVPEVFARYRVTVHVPRRPYARALPGIPTIRPFEALACGIPLVSAPWQDSENLFRPGRDFLFAKCGCEMTRALENVLTDPALSESLRESGLQTVRSRHTSAHRVDQLFEILRGMN